ncbi:hypothetical protein [Candidatus Uabimicrobium sp. HlEnr_7]|uniref:hypothetical protein n=1 Tax=Candidatus Uabimicrobium helgolandensis TaxID=3095367 RepID=UPI0035562983
MRLAFILLIITLSGCINTRVGDFTVLSTKNVDTSNYIVVGRFESEIKNDVKSAVDDCLEKGGGNILINAVVEYRERFFSGYVVIGDVCIRKKAFPLD